MLVEVRIRPQRKLCRELWTSRALPLGSKKQRGVYILYILSVNMNDLHLEAQVEKEASHSLDAVTSTRGCTAKHAA